jgi:hypothetical protein
MCREPNCKAVWFTGNLIGGGVPASGRIRNTTVSPCPACGGEGKLADIDFVSSQVVIPNSPSNAAIVAALQAVADQVESGSSIDDAVQEAAASLGNSDKGVFLKVAAHLGKVLKPENIRDVGVYVAWIVAYLTYASAQNEPTSVAVPTHLEEVLEDIACTLQSHPACSDTPPEQSRGQYAPVYPGPSISTLKKAAITDNEKPIVRADLPKTESKFSKAVRRQAKRLKRKHRSRSRRNILNSPSDK